MPLPSPPGPGRYIPYGDLQAIRRSPLLALARIAQRYGDVFQYPVGFWTIYAVSGPAGARHVLQEHSRNYSKATFQYNLLGLVAGQGLLSSDGAHWLRQRRLMQPAFHRDRLARLAQLTTDATAATLCRWEIVAARGEPLEIDGEMMRLTLEIVGKALFSVDLAHDADALSRAALATLDHIAHRARSPLAFPSKVPTPRNHSFMAAIHTLDRAIFALIARRRRHPDEADDLLSLFMLARDAETGEGMTDRQLRDEIITFLIAAGHETVASALVWTWYALAASRRRAETARGTRWCTRPTPADDERPAAPTVHTHGRGRNTSKSDRSSPSAPNTAYSCTSH